MFSDELGWHKKGLENMALKYINKVTLHSQRQATLNSANSQSQVELNSTHSQRLVTLNSANSKDNKHSILLILKDL